MPTRGAAAGRVGWTARRHDQDLPQPRRLRARPPGRGGGAPPYHQSAAGGRRHGMRPVVTVLFRQESVRQSNGSWKALCPAHEDREPSLSVTEGDDGRALLKCFAGCKNPEIVGALDLDMGDLFVQRNGHRKNLFQTPRKRMQPCNLANYAKLKGLPLEFLEKLGLSDRKHQNRSSLHIPATTESRQEGAVRFRIGLEKPEEGDDRFRWRTGSKAMLYGLWRLETIRKAGWVVLVEGESDTHTLWYHGIPALGIPGVDTWKEAWGDHLKGIERIYAVIEPDQGGATLKDKLSASSIRDRLHLVDLQEFKDASELHVADPELFKQRFTEALKSATPWAEVERQETRAAARKAWAECEGLVLVPNILERFAEDLSRSGVVGESRLAKLLYLAVRRPGVMVALRDDLRLALDRVSFAEKLGIVPDPWQENLLRSTSDRVLLNCARQSGKSLMSAVIALHQALYHPGSLVLILAPAERQAKETFSKVARMYAIIGERVAPDSYRKLGMELKNRSRIEALPGTEKTIRGFSGVDLLILDEAARVADELYFAVRPMLAVSGGALMMLSTPAGRRGVFFEEWTGHAAWERYEVPAAEIPRISEEFLQEERASLPARIFRQEYECSFEDVDDQVFGYELIARAITPEVAPLFAGAAPAGPSRGCLDK